MNPLIKEISKQIEFKEILDNIYDKKNINIVGLVDSAKAHIIYSIRSYINMCPVVVCPNVSAAKKLTTDLKFYSSKEIIFLPAREVIYYDAEVESREIENARVYAITKLLEGSDCIIVTTIEAACQKMMPKSFYENKLVNFERGKELELDKCASTFTGLGYARADVVEVRGQFAIRGGIIDVFPTDSQSPYRIELFGDEIDSIRLFDPVTQKSSGAVDSFTLSFSKEYCFEKKDILNGINKLEEYLGSVSDVKTRERIKKDIESIKEKMYTNYVYKYYNLFVQNSSNMFEYLNEKHVVYFDENIRCLNRAKSIAEENKETLKIMLEKNNIDANLAFSYLDDIDLQSIKRKMFNISFERIDKSSDFVQNINERNNNWKSDIEKNGLEELKLYKQYLFNTKEFNFSKTVAEMQISDIKKYLADGKLVFGVFPNNEKLESMKNLLEYNNILVKQAINIDDESLYEVRENRKAVYLCKGMLSSGYIYEDMNIVVLSEEISGTGSTKKVSKSSKDFLGEALNSYDDLKVEDYVVHIKHGIGIYKGVETVETYGTVKDYIKIEYRDGGIIYVPITSLEYVKKYICEDGYVPKLNSIGSKEWAKTKAKVSTTIKDIAKDLIKLYSKRKQEIGYAFSKDTPWQREFESDFEYELTDDQKRCVEEMKKDMESNKPMDRLLCGDVGYGKTEVAIRGAFKAVMDSKQVAYLVPTTVLCLQQYNVFKHRMEDYGIRVEMLSRFRTKKEQEGIVKKLKDGEIDVVVGTHRLLSKDIGFKDLGFLIIDEEHRFGVEHKETIKKYKNGVDSLCMTATPIPRTLHMSMIGIRDVSVILDPPQERLPVHTYVMEYNEDIVKEAIEKELERDGQVFYLNNRVENIDTITEKVRRLATVAKVEQAHGQMSPSKMENIMMRYMERKIDILVCTTILESGIDIPNANTIIVENADKLGLAQLYQIRGRVGRSNRLAHAYITYKKGSALSEEAEKRLTSIREYTEFGSGLKIALRDLEIRGAGNLLGVRQHGHITDIGYEMYSAMLEREIRNQKKALEEGKESSDGIFDENILESDNDVRINLDVSACIPNKYIDSNSIKIEMYQKLAETKDEESLREVTLELIDRFGEMPKETENLIKVIEIRNLCKAVGITEIKINCEHLVILPFNIKIRLTFEEKRDILLHVNETLQDIVKNKEKYYKEGKY